MINETISEKQQSLEQICERHGVLSLAVFGSATAGGFESENSDLDFVVEFRP